MTPVRWGVAGTGTMAADFVRALADVPDSRLVAVASRSAGRADGFARSTGGRAHGSYDELFADAEVEVVYVAASNDRHADLAQSALEAGKHVLVEKPFALDSVQAQAVADTAARSGRFCMEAMWTRFLPAVARVQQLLDEGAVGDPRLLVASLGFDRRPPAPSALLDLGVYPISMAHLLFGAPTRVEATSVAGPDGVDVLDLLTLVHPDERVSQLACATGVHLDNRLVVTGDAGRITVGAPMLRPERIVVERLGPIATSGPGTGRAARLRHHPIVQRTRGPVSAVAARARGRRRTEHLPYLGNGYVHEIEEVHRCLAEGRTESPRLTLAESVDVIRTVDRARQAAAHG